MSGSPTIFRDPDQAIEAFKAHGQSGIRIMSLTSFRWDVAIRNYGMVSAFSTRLTPTIFDVGGLHDTTLFSIVAEGSPPVFRNGVETTEHDIIIYGFNADLCCRVNYPRTRLLAVAIPNKEISRLFDEPLPISQKIRPSAASLRKLRHTHRAAIAGNGSQSGLVYATINCLETAENVVKFRDSNRARTVFRFQGLLENNHCWPRFLDDICAELGVHERTLRRACTDYLGINPHEYITCFRLNMVRQVLKRAGFATRVSDIAAEYGFNDHGRFARLYRQCFGELPSDTLRSYAASSAATARRK